MTTVVGFSFPIFHDNSVAVILDGKVVFALEEERYTRHKHAFGEPPVYSLAEAFRFLLSRGIKPNDVDAFAVGFNPKNYPMMLRYVHLRSSLIQGLRIAGVPSGKGSTTGGEFLKDSFVSVFKGFDYLSFAKIILRAAAKQVGEKLPPKIRVIPVTHHLAHAASAHYFSGFGSSTIITIDGVGETESTVVWKGTNGEFEEIASIGIDKGSIGILYESVSERLRLGRLEGPGKVMGLAPYGSYDKGMAERFGKILEASEGGKSGLPYIFAKEFRLSSPGKTLREVIAKYNQTVDFVAGETDLSWDPTAKIAKSVASLAWHVQDFTEKVVLLTARWAKDQTGSDKIALAGGVALNAKSNMELHYSRIFNDLFIFPAASDAGVPAGAAAWVYEHICGGKMSHGRLKHAYLGPEYSDDYLKQVVEKSKYKADFVANDLAEVSELVSRGCVVAWFQGKAELGPRALGNRSIIADPTLKQTWKIVNRIKGREFWRPLAPSLLAEDKSVYFKDPVDHEFMILMLKFRDESHERVPAVCHVDDTARPQTVDRDTNRTWYELIRSFKEITGEGLIVNTSFNLAGEPLVQTPEDAIRSFSIGGFDAIYLQGWLIRKNQ